jgi:hypothetical protein
LLAVRHLGTFVEISCLAPVCHCPGRRRKRKHESSKPIKTVIMARRSRFGSRSVTAGLLLAGIVWTILLGAPTKADPLYTVSGVAVDTSASDASSAKLKAISEAQVKAFAVLLERLGGAGASARLEGLQPADIGRMMDSLSIEEERTGPGRYIGRLTIRFLPDKVRAALAGADVAFTEDRAPAVVVVPVWLGPDGPEAWTNNPWRAGWLALNAQDSLVPLIIPLGDLTDSQTLAAEQALNGDRAGLEAMRARYSADAIIVSVAAPLDGSTVRATMIGETATGSIDFDRTYTAEHGGVAAAAERAVQEFHSAMLAEWRTSRPHVRPTAVQSIRVALPLTSLEQWNDLRARLMATPGVAGVDLSSLSGQGAIVRLNFSVPFPALQAELAQRRLDLALRGETWVIQPY